ncbi:DUF975 family protein [Cyclobacterium qasimii]|uniref:Integral membrane protein n=2 Tax=Cyclobacterium qasimii TaxID=1350429 RepID=S7VDN1_9BACT|nr:DUF975 family protein [Cyclobacterium qasimii]EPR68350.1 Integral membrane protein [Cyclobacterium qasimii M12-11B]GEO23604.1 membrane protein [Cyclobacterium qasimii]
MGTENVALMKMARESLKGNWGLAIGTFLVYYIIMGFLQGMAEYYPMIGLGTLIITGPMVLGLSLFSLTIARNQYARLQQIFDGFNNFGTALGAYLLIIIFVLLWMLLLIIPGIIAGLSYAMTFYIIADDPTIGPLDAIDKSKQMMNGYKMKLFLLFLMFFGMALLCILTLGIGFLWLIPFINVTTAKFYEDIKEGAFTLETI